MASHQGNHNSGTGGHNNMRWGHGAAPDGSWEYTWEADSTPGGFSFGYGSGSARSAAGTAFGFGCGGAFASSAGLGTGPRQTQHGFGEPYMYMFYNGMSFGQFPMGHIFGPPRPPHSTDGSGGRGDGSARFSR